MENIFPILLTCHIAACAILLIIAVVLGLKREEFEKALTLVLASQVVNLVFAVVYIILFLVLPLVTTTTTH